MSRDEPQVIDDKTGTAPMLSYARQSEKRSVLFEVLFVLWGLVPTLLLVLSRGGWEMYRLFVAGATITWWLVALALLYRTPRGFQLAMILVSAMWLLAILQFLRRVQFMVVNGGMERADGFGSPLAFLLGFVVEQVFLTIPLTFLFVHGLFQWRRRRIVTLRD